jgi:carbonic anhydrase
MGHNNFHKDIVTGGKMLRDKTIVPAVKIAAGEGNTTEPVLFIGCSDSRVPAGEIMGSQTVDVFVHRNTANMVLHTDKNMLSVVDYAVNILRVKQIVVCGHYGCTGISAALSRNNDNATGLWVNHLKEVYGRNAELLNAIQNENERFNTFAEVNVREQVYDLALTTVVQQAWKNGLELTLHGWVYNPETNGVKELDINISDNSSLEYINRMCC